MCFTSDATIMVAHIGHTVSPDSSKLEKKLGWEISMAHLHKTTEGSKEIKEYYKYSVFPGASSSTVLCNLVAQREYRKWTIENPKGWKIWDGRPTSLVANM